MYHFLLVHNSIPFRRKKSELLEGMYRNLWRLIRADRKIESRSKSYRSEVCFRAAWPSYPRRGLCSSVMKSTCPSIVVSFTILPLHPPSFLSKFPKPWVVVSSISFSGALASVAVFPSAFVLSSCLFSGFCFLVCYRSLFGSKFLVRISPFMPWCPSLKG